MALTVEHWQDIATGLDLVDAWLYENTAPPERGPLPDELGDWLYSPGLFYVVESSLSYGDTTDMLLRHDTGTDHWLPEQDVLVVEGDYVGKRLADGVVFVPDPLLYGPV